MLAVPLAVPNDFGIERADRRHTFYSRACLYCCRVDVPHALAETKPRAEKPMSFICGSRLVGRLVGCSTRLSPSIFSTLVEYPIAVVAACLLRPMTGERNLTKDLLYAAGVLALTAAIAIGARLMDVPPTPMRTLLVIGLPVILSFVFAACLALALGAVFLATHLLQVGSDSRILYADRSFGVHRVLQSKLGRFHLLAHGTTLHGIQDKENPDDRLLITQPTAQSVKFLRRINSKRGIASASASAAVRHMAGRGRNLRFLKSIRW